MEALRIKRGNPFLASITLTGLDGQPLNLTEVTVLFTVRSLTDKALTDDAALIKQAITDHYEPGNGQTYLDLSSEQTTLPPGTYIGDVRVVGSELKANTDPFLVEIEPIVTTRIIEESVLWGLYWDTLISATVEDAAPTDVILTFPEGKPELIDTDITATVNGIARAVSSASWTGAAWTVVLASAVEYGDVVVMTFVKTGGTTAVTNNVAEQWSSYWATREPSALSLTTVSESRIDATWTDGAEAGDGLRVYYSTDNVTFIEHGTANFGDEAYSLTSLPEARHIYVKVVAYSGTNESTGDTADDYTAMKILLTSTGTGAGVSTLRLWFDTTPVTCTLSGAGRFYSDSGGTADESTSYEFPAGSLQTRYLKVPSSTSNLLIFHKGNMLGWGSDSTDGWTSSNNAATAAVSTEDFARDMVYFYCAGSNTISGDLSDLPSELTYFHCQGYNTISGDLSDLPSELTYFRCQGYNTISGDLSGLPSELTYFYCTGPNTVSGDLSGLPSELTYFRCQGYNTISGDLSDLPSELTYFYCTGSNTVSGDLSDLPSELTYFRCAGSNTISDYTAPHTWSNSINYINLIQAVGSGLSETEVDNLLIDLASATWAGSSRRVELPAPNAPRSSASDAAVATLLGKSVTVVTA